VYREVEERIEWGLEEEQGTENMKEVMREEEEYGEEEYLEERSRLRNGEEGIRLRGMTRENREESQRRHRGKVS